MEPNWHCPALVLAHAVVAEAETLGAPRSEVARVGRVPGCARVVWVR
jgi:hypothetical protein